MTLQEIISSVAVAGLIGIGTMSIDAQRENAAQERDIQAVQASVQKLEPKMDELADELRESQIQMAALTAELKNQRGDK